MSEKDLNKENPNYNHKEDNFSLPEGYFNSFSSRLFGEIVKNEELKDFPLLVSLQKKNPFIVPEDYFDLKKELLQYPLLAENKKTIYTTPHLYFENLTEKINQAVSVTEEKETYPILYSHKKENIFSIPEKYFEDFTPIVKPGNKVISLYKRIHLSYKIAATITLLLGLGILFFRQQNNPTVNNDCNTFACLDKKEILNSSYVLHGNEDNIIDLINEKSLSDSLLLKKNGKTQKVDMDDVSDNLDINTLTDNL